jgi:hypothetical protein
MQVQADGDRNVLHDGQRQVCAGYALCTVDDPRFD